MEKKKRERTDKYSDGSFWVSNSKNLTQNQ